MNIIEIKMRGWVLTEGNGRANAGEDEEQGGDKLGDVRLDGGGAERVIEAAEGDSWHFTKLILEKKERK